jgi:hypothetical protein
MTARPDMVSKAQVTRTNLREQYQRSSTQADRSRPRDRTGRSDGGAEGCLPCGQCSRRVSVPAQVSVQVRIRAAYLGQRLELEPRIKAIFVVLGRELDETDARQL